MSCIQKKSPEFLSERYWVRLLSLGKPFEAPEPIWVRAACSDWRPRHHTSSIAIVGTRRPTAYGMRFVSSFLSELARRLPVAARPLIVSGGALGTDAWAHECALRWGFLTESWVVGPVRAPNPRSNAQLFASIVASGGALICPDSLEPTGGVGPFKSDWVLRNAYLVARVDAVLVPEANEKSGTWSSVRWANRMGVPVFALPGPIDQTTSLGTNAMISSGYAHPIASAVKLMEDLVVWGVLGPYNKGRDEDLARSRPFAKLEQKLCGLEGLQVVDLPGLSEQMGLKLELLCEYLLNEIREGKLRRVGNGFERRS